MNCNVPVDNKLTEKQLALVDTLVMTGCSVKDAALSAGYSPGSGGESARVVGSKTLRLPHVQEYMRRRMAEAFNDDAVNALAVLRGLMANADSEYIRFNAACAILDRAGYGKGHQRAVIDTGNFTVTIDLGD